MTDGTAGNTKGPSEGRAIRFEDDGRLAYTPTHAVALECLSAGVSAAVPERIVDERVSIDDGALRLEAVDGTIAEYDLGAYDTIRLVGAGKAAGGTGAAIAKRLGGRLQGGVLVTEESGTDAVSEPLTAFAGDHPLPSDRGVAAARRVIETVERAGADDLVIVVLTGGGSALLAAPADPLSVSDLRALTAELLACGASIGEINAVRKHCSAVKGGRLARIAAPATVVTLTVSDVVGDDVGVIASGPTAPDPTTYGTARRVGERYDLDLPATVSDHLAAGVDGERPETPTADDPAFDRARTLVIANGRTALDAAATAAADRGYDPLVLAAGVRGESREAALTHVAIAEECLERESPAAPPCVLLSGGETTVTLGTDPGRGGPNTEFAASAGVALADDRTPSSRVVVASVDTDGIDGTSDAAGGIVDASTVDPDAARDALAGNDVAPLLASADALLRTGPTGTNVNDLRVIVVEDPEE